MYVTQNQSQASLKNPLFTRFAQQVKKNRPPIHRLYMKDGGSNHNVSFCPHSESLMFWPLAEGGEMFSMFHFIP